MDGNRSVDKLFGRLRLNDSLRIGSLRLGVLVRKEGASEIIKGFVADKPVVAFFVNAMH